MYQSSYFDLTEKQKAKAKNLTLKEQEAVNTFLAAAKAMPKSLYIQLDDGELLVGKRMTPNSGCEVAKLRKRSLDF